MAFSVFTTTHDLGHPFGRAISNAIFGACQEATHSAPTLCFLPHQALCASSAHCLCDLPVISCTVSVPPTGAFTPSLDDNQNYEDDSPSFRTVVWNLHT